MKIKLILMAILLGPTFSVSASVGCNILMKGFDNDGKKNVYDLSTSEKKEYDQCLEQMKLTPNSFKAFEKASEAEAKRRNLVYKKKQNDEKKQKEADEKQKKIRESRAEYSFSGEELKEMFKKPVYAYRFAARVDYSDNLAGLHYKADKLSDADKLCGIIGKESGIKNMKARSSKLELTKAHYEVERLSNSGVTFPDGFFSNTFEIFETSKKDIEKMNIDGSRAIKVLEFSDLTCVANDNKDDDFEDIEAETILVTKSKEIKFSSKEDEVIITESLEVGQNRDRDIDDGRSDDTFVNDSDRGSIDDEADRLLGVGKYDTTIKRVKTVRVRDR